MIVPRSLLAAAVLLVAAAPAQASFPGANGDLVVSVDARGDLSSDLFTLPSQGGAVEQLTDSGAQSTDERQAYVAAPEAAPDGGSVLAFTNTVPSGLATVPAGGGAPTEVPNPLELFYDTLDGSPAPSFAPDGDSYAAVGKDGLYEVFLDAREPRRIVASGRLRMFAPRWSPDGKLIAVEVAGGPKKAGIWLYNATTGAAVRRVSRRGMDADWSPDGRKLVFRTHYQQREVEGGASGGNLFVVRRDGTGTRSLVHRENIAETQPTWSPDGKRVAWVALGFSSGDVSFRVSPSVWSVKASGGKPKRLVRLARPYVEEGYFHAPELTWLPAAP